MPHDPDRSLVDRAAAGDHDAFGALVLRYQARLVNLAKVMAAEADAEDLAQEAFIRAYKAIGKFRGESTFRTWLYRVAINVINSHHASRGRRWRLFGALPPRDEDEAAAVAEIPSAAPSAEDEAMRRELIDQALSSLPPDMRIALTLRDVQGFEYAEIADMLGVPIGTVESRIFRARQRLRPLLAPLIGVER